MDFGFFLSRTLPLVLVSWIALWQSRPFQFEKNANVPIMYPFKLTLSIDHESYSRISDSIGGGKNPHVQLILDLTLRFTNETNKVVKLDEDSILLDSTVIYDSPIVGPSVPLLPDREISSKVQGCTYLADEKLLAILPGKFYETSLQMKFEVIDHGTFHPPESLRPGSYLLKITVSTWWEIEGQDVELKEKWRKPGVLVGKSVPSELMGFVVAGKPVRRRV